MSKLENIDSNDVWLVLRRSAQASEEDQIISDEKARIWKENALKHGLIKDKKVTTDDYGSFRMKDDEEMVIQIPKEKNYTFYYMLYVIISSFFVSLILQYVDVVVTFK